MTVIITVIIAVAVTITTAEIITVTTIIITIIAIIAEEILDGNLKAGDTAKLTAKEDTIQVKIKIKK